jgi:hypothetical protein
MPANARFCMDCGSERRAGGPTDGGEQTTGSGIIVVSTGGKRPVSHALTDPTEEVIVIDDEGRATMTVQPAEEVVEDDPAVVATEPEPVQPATGRITRKRVLIAGAGLAVVALIAAAVALLWPDSETPVDVNAELTTGATAFTETMTAFSRGDLMADWSAASAEATDLLDTFDARRDVVAEVKDEEVREAATAVLDAQATAIESFALTFADYGVANFRRWDRRATQMQARLDQLDAAQQDLAALGQEELTATVDVPAAEEVLTDLGRLVEDKRVEWNDWVEARNFALGSQAAASFGLQQYAAPARSIMAEYQGLRDDLADWTAEIDTRIVTVSEAYLEFGAAAEARRAVRNRFAALQPPPALSAAHSSLLGIVDEAIGAIDAAVEGLNIYLNDPFYVYWDARDTPGWQTFSSASDRITTQFETARAAWDTALTGEENRIQTSGIPPRPEI